MTADIICFFVALLVFYKTLPYSRRLTLTMISDFIMAKRMRRTSSSNVSGRVKNVEEEKEDAGLSVRGPTFGANELFNFIAEKNKGLIEEMQQLLQKAGIRHKNALLDFMKQKAIASIALFIFALLYLVTENISLPFGISVPIIMIGSVVGGHMLTNMYMRQTANKRKDAIEHGVPDLVDLMVICSESGLDLNRSIRRIARELRTSNPVLADELSLTSIELEMIPDHKLVFQNLEDRTDCMEIKTFSKTLSQSIEYGSSLSVSLRDLALESRQKRMINAETKAAQAPALLTLPMMLFIMPCLFIVMLGPLIISVVRDFGGK